MTRPGFRVFVTRHHRAEDHRVGDPSMLLANSFAADRSASDDTEPKPQLWSAVLLRRSRVFGEPPAPAAIAPTIAGALELLTPVVAGLEDPERYRWTEPLELRGVEVAIKPGRRDPQRGFVIAGGNVPIRLRFATAKLSDGLFLVIVPRFDWQFVSETLEAVPDTIRSLIFASLVGDSPASLYDLRREIDEQIIEWNPPTRKRGDTKKNKGHSDDTDDSDDDDDTDNDEVPTVESVARDWVALARARKLPAVVHASRHIDEWLGTRPSLLIVGPRGVGKTTLVVRIAHHLLRLQREKKRRYRLWATSADRILAGTMYLGMWQERCLSIVRELADSDDVLYVDRLADILAPATDGASIAEVLAPAVALEELTLIAECDEQELVAARQRLPGFVDAMQVIRIEEPSSAEIVNLIGPYGQRKAPPVTISDGAAVRLIDLLATFRRDTAFPGKALNFVDYLTTRSPVSAYSTSELLTAFAEWSGLPVDLLNAEVAFDTAAAATALKAGVIGQDHACWIAGRVIARLKAGLHDPDRPIGSLLLTGPTGVGKTELAKQLARVLFGASGRLIRVDMGELASSASLTRLVTPTAAGTSLADQIRAQPLSIVLFDEIEKAHPAAFDLLLGVLGDGRFTDSLGRVTDFRMAIIVMTSNLGASASERSGFAASDGFTDRPTAAVTQFFRPEFVARIDSVIAFKPLGHDHLLKIVDLELTKLVQRPGIGERQLAIDVSPAARLRLAELGHDPKLGARLLRRTIEERIVGPLAQRLAADPALKGTTIRIRTPSESGTQPDTLFID